jgi:transcriptional accessory protein Tex/SPT6
LIQKLLAIILLFSIIFSEKINLNNASSPQLESVGFTPSEINRILEYRRQVGYFETVYDLLNIDMKIDKIHAIRNDVSVDLPTLSTFEKDIKRASYKLEIGRAHV